MAMASVSAQLIHMSSSRQSRGPVRVDLMTPKAPNSELITDPLNRNLRTAILSSTRPRYRD